MSVSPPKPQDSSSKSQHLSQEISSPTKLDISKLHAEINQIVNQRHTLVTFSITFVGAMFAWFMPTLLSDSEGSNNLHIIIFSASILCTLLMFFLFYHSLMKKTRVMTTYLIATESSPWEVHWKRYREDCTYKGDAGSQIGVFYFLGFASFLLLVYYLHQRVLTVEDNIGFVVLSVLFSFYVVLVWRLKSSHRNKNENKFLEDWKKCLDISKKEKEELSKVD